MSMHCTSSVKFNILIHWHLRASSSSIHLIRVNSLSAVFQLLSTVKSNNQHTSCGNVEVFDNLLSSTGAGVFIQMLTDLTTKMSAQMLYQNIPGCKPKLPSKCRLLQVFDDYWGLLIAADVEKLTILSTTLFIKVESSSPYQNIQPCL